MISKLRLMVMSHLTCERAVCVCGHKCLYVGVPLVISSRWLKPRPKRGALGEKTASLVSRCTQAQITHYGRRPHGNALSPRALCRGIYCE